MSSENVELVERIHDAWRRGQAREATHLLDPEIEWVNPPDAVEPGVRRGVAQFRGALGAVSDTFDRPVVETEEVIDAGNKVVVVGVLRGRGQSSGASVERRQGYVWTVRDGRAVRFAWFNDPAAALRDAGIEPGAEG